MQDCFFNYADKIAHRGASVIAPENTLESLQKAVQAGASSVEFDVMLSRDGVPVVMHDDTLNRTTNGSGHVRDYDYHHIAQLDAGSWFGAAYKGVKVPTLQQWLVYAAGQSCALNIELKPRRSDTKQLVRSVCKLLEQCWTAELPPPLISSSNQSALLEVYRINPAAQLAYVSHYWPFAVIALLKRLHCQSLNINYKRLTQARVKMIHDAGFKVLAYTVNNAADQQRLKQWGVDGVFSDYV